MNKNTIRTLSKHGLPLARQAFRLHRGGEGCNTVGIYLGLHWKTADALIDAGREVAYVESNFTRAKPFVPEPEQPHFEIFRAQRNSDMGDAVRAALWPDPRND